ncbi:hypothetical protein KAI36_02517 [Paenibacillus sp. S02]|nr:hypothetical protein KAI36_02517 [Paenibacillus sp. S02]
MALICSVGIFGYLSCVSRTLIPVPRPSAVCNKSLVRQVNAAMTGQHHAAVLEI